MKYYTSYEIHRCRPINRLIARNRIGRPRTIRAKVGRIRSLKKKKINFWKNEFLKSGDAWHLMKRFNRNSLFLSEPTRFCGPFCFNCSCGCPCCCSSSCNNSHESFDQRIIFSNPYDIDNSILIRVLLKI